MTAKTRYTFTVNAVDAGSNILKTIYTDADSYEGKTHTIVYPKYLTGSGNIVTYSKDDDTYGESKTASASNETYEVSYTAYDGVAYFVEVEDVVSATAYGSWNCSNGGAVRGFTTAKDVFTVPATGVYDITYAACNNNVNYDLAVTLSKNETEIATKSDLKSVSVNYIKSTGIVSESNVSLASGDVLSLTPSSTNGIIDYMLIELKSVPVTITSAGYATFSSAYAVSIPDGVEAYAAKLNGDKVTLTKVDGDVPANTGVILKAAEGVYDLSVVASAEAIDTDLLPSDGSVTGDGSIYVLNNVGGKVGFYKLAIGNTLEAGKAYLEIIAESPARGFIGFEGATGINEVNVNKAAVAKTGKIYNLNGQIVSKPSKGLFIVDGKVVSF